MPKVSVILTCFNLGLPHRGLAEARNAGIRHSRGEYILPLDADDRISPDYMSEAVAAFARDDDLKIVYCDAEWFGARSGPVRIPDFSVQDILSENIIFCSAFFRRRDYDETGGYDPRLPCLEDWDLWLSLLERGGKVHRIPKTHFYRRHRNDSMLRTMGRAAKGYSVRRIFAKHEGFYQREGGRLGEMYQRLAGFEVKKAEPTGIWEIRAGRLIRQAKKTFGGGRPREVKPPGQETESFVLNRPPQAYHFLMTNYCNAQCFFCNQRFAGAPKKEITLEILKAIAANIPVTGAEYFHFGGGGEPMANPHLLPIIRYVNQCWPWVKVIVRTNGLFIEKTAGELAELDIWMLEVSVHGLAETNNAFLQRDDSDVIFSGIARLRAYQGRTKKKITVHLMPAVSARNIDEVPALVRKAAEWGDAGVRVHFCRYYRDGSDEEWHERPREEDSLYFHKRRYDRAIRTSRRLAKKLGVAFAHEPLFSARFETGQSCRQPWRIMLIDWDGDVYPCCGGEERFKNKVKSGEYCFGNLLREDVFGCWNNSRYVELRKTCSPAYEGVLEPECVDCHMSLCFKGPNFKGAHIIRQTGSQLIRSGSR